MYVYIIRHHINHTSTPREFLSFDSTPHGHHHVTCVLRLLMSTSRCLATTPTSHNWYSTCGKPCYRPHFVTPGGVPNTNIIRNVPRLPNLLVSYQGLAVRATTCTLIPTTLANSSHNSRIPRVYPSSRATTQEMPFRATTQGMPHA